MFKKFCIGVIAITLAILVGVGAFVYTVDPFNVYRADKDMTKIIYQNPYYQNIGIAKYTEYDTLVTGTSMTQNFRGWWFDEKFGCKAIRLSFDGGITSDFKALLDTAIENNKELKTVYFGLDNYVITADSKLNDISDRIPDYMLDNNPFSKVKYLFNKDIIFDYTVTYNSYKKLDTYDFYEMHAWDTLNPTYSKESVLKGYSVPEKSDKKPLDTFMSASNDFLNAIEPIVAENENINFVFFAPPYSILYWNTQKQEGSLDATMYSLEYVYSKLLQYNNVKMFYFQNDADRITNLDNYKDATHYRTEYNKFMLECFADGQNEITKDNYKIVLDGMKIFAESYDYDSLTKE